MNKVRMIMCLMALLCASTMKADNAETDGKSIQYRGHVEAGVGAAYNVNTAQTVSTLNMQTLWSIGTSHGVKYKGMFGGLGLEYNHSQRDKENMYLFYGDVRYTFEKCKIQPMIGVKGGMIYDPYWTETTKPYGALSGSVKVYDKFRVGLEGTIFKRPARHFTANALVVVSYTIGKK